MSNNFSNMYVQVCKRRLKYAPRNVIMLEGRRELLTVVNKSLNTEIDYFSEFLTFELKFYACVL